jgi:twitching motility protein PilT
MSDGFSWDKVLGEGETPADGAEAPTEQELQDIMDAIPEEGAKEPEPAAEVPDSERYVPEFVPRNLVEPAAPTERFDLMVNDDDGYVPSALKSTSPKPDTKNQLEVTASSSQLEARPVAQVHIDDILREAVERRASDIHITVGLPPSIRLDGEIVPLSYEPMTAQQSQRIMYEILSDDHLEKFEQTHELDFGHVVKGCARFRVNVYMQRGTVAAALRVIPNRVPSYDELALPPVIREIATRSSGIILVTGPTGSGKSTTIAAMLDDINENRTSHIMTIEDPIEYLHTHKKCMVNQREMHSDTYSFHNSLRAVLREDPDIILVGELRDLETIEAALTLAETGHLVFGTLHTRNAPASVDRLVDVFPSDAQDQIRVLLANTLEGIVSQQLLPKIGGGRCAAMEIMTGVAAVKNLIREGKTHQMYSVIETSRSIGMQTMDWSLAELYKRGLVNYEECLLRAVDKESFARLAKSAA